MKTRSDPQTVGSHPQSAGNERSLTDVADEKGVDEGKGQKIKPLSISRLLEKEDLAPGLYVVATPIGNMADITLRALRILYSVDLVFAEDTRHSRKLLNYYGIEASLISYHEHNERARVAAIIQKLQMGQSLALVTDAGTPGISDPGHMVIKTVVEAGLRVEVIPGACAFILALVGSGLPTDSFSFHGFLPPKSGPRCKELTSLRQYPHSLVFLAPPHGLSNILVDMVKVFGGERRVCVARELTKMHEEFFRSNLQEASKEFERRSPRGEICIVVEGAAPLKRDAAEEALTVQLRESQEGTNSSLSSEQLALKHRAGNLLKSLIQAGMPVSSAAKTAAKELGVPKKSLYQLALKMRTEMQL